MSNLGRKVAGGAIWMLGFRLAQRGIGLLSTVVLARLLVPEDFGLVAMAMAIYGLVDLLSQFGFDTALIHKQDADRRHYDTAWTLNLVFRTLCGLLLIIAAPLGASLLEEPRLEAVIYVIAIVSLVQGFENIGIVAFRKDFHFNMEFHFRIAKKLIAFVVTVSLAFALRNHWALVLGIVASHLGATVLSYVMHPYRPRPSLAGTRDLLGFSGWVLVNSLFRFLRLRGPELLIGRLAGSGGLGVYKIAYEVSTLPTAELYAPIMRAVFPGFSRIAHDTPRLREAYLSVQGVVAAVTVPAGLGIVVLAGPLVHLLLGDKWLEAIPLIQVIGLFGVIQVLHGNRFSLFMALGRPNWVAWMNLLQGILVLGFMTLLLWKGHGVAGAVWALVMASLVTLPVGLFLVSRAIDLSPRRFLAIQLRPVISSVVMAAVMWSVSVSMPPIGGPLDAAAALAAAGGLGGTVYLLTLFALWRMAGSPAGPETRLLELSRLDRFVGTGRPGPDPSR